MEKKKTRPTGQIFSHRRYICCIILCCCCIKALWHFRVSYLMDYSIISTVQELSYRRFFYFRHSGIVQKTDMSGSLTAGWSFPLGHKMCLQFIITQVCDCHGKYLYIKNENDNVTAEMEQLMLFVYFFRRPQTSVLFIVMTNWKMKCPCSQCGSNT